MRDCLVIQGRSLIDYDVILIEHTTLWWPLWSMRMEMK